MLATRYSLPATSQARSRADQCLALLWLHLVTAGPQGGGGHAFYDLLALPSRLPRRPVNVKPAFPKAA